MRVLIMATAVVALTVPETPAVAQAPVGKVVTAGFGESPVFAGDRVSWFESRSQGRRLSLLSAMPSSVGAEVQSFSAPPDGQPTYIWGNLAASASRLVLTTSSFAGGELSNPGIAPFHDYYEGGPAGPLEHFGRCAGPQDDPRAADVWADAFVYRQCDDGDGHVEIRDTSSEPPSRSVGSGGRFARIAGRFVAWLDGAYYPGSLENAGDVVVYDRAADAEVYRLSPAKVPGKIYSLDVQEDGKIGISFDDGKRPGNSVVVGWASPQEPFVHRVALPEDGEYMVRMAGDRIAFQGGPSTNFTLQHALVGIADLQGRARIIARNTDARVFSELMDFDGERVVWRELGCGERRLVIRAVDDSGTAGGGATRCPLRLLRRPVVRHGHVTLRFGCGAFSTPCTFRPVLRIARGGHLAGKTKIGRHNPVRVRLTKAARRRLVRQRSLRLRVRVRLVDRGAREQIRRGTIRIQKP